MENTKFDEIDLSVLYTAVVHKVNTTKWNFDDESEWEMLQHLMGLKARIGRALDGI